MDLSFPVFSRLVFIFFAKIDKNAFCFIRYN